MNTVMTTLLLIEDDPVEARQIQEALAGTTGTLFRFEWAKTLADALDRLGHGGIEIVLLDLTLSGGQGVAAFDKVFEAAPDALILVLGAASDEETTRQAIQRGANDYLSKGHVDAHWLPRALRYLIERKLAIRALRSSEARFRAISDASPLGIFVSNAQGLCAYSNSAYHKIAGQSLEQTLGTHWGDALHPEDRARVLEEWQLALRDQTPFQSEARFLREDASIVWGRLNDAAMIDERAVLGRVLTVEDISERKAEELALRTAEDALFEEKERAQVTLNSIGDAVLCTDLQGRVSYLNQIAETMTGWALEEARGRPLAEVFRIINSTTRQIAENPASRAIEENKTLGLAADCALIRRDGLESAIEDSIAPIHNREGRVTGAVIVFHDVSESRAMALRMSHLAQHDFLTGLPNRVLLTERLSQAVRLALRHHKQGALLFLDLDDFKQINDSLGHAVGDQLLKQVAERLSACVRITDTVCRQGGDEFVILLAEIEQAQDAARVAENVLKALAAPHLIEGHELHVTVSIGISIYPDDGVSVDNVIQNADTAMYHAKASGRNSHEFFRTDMNLRSVQRLFLEGRLHRALKNGEFLLYYQPQIDIVSGTMTGAEALIRWMDPDLGLILPAQFVPVAEECGLITQIGYWVLHEACRQVRAWQASGLEAVPVAVNVSAIEFRQKGFLEGLALILKETGMPPHLLELELTESVLMHDAESSVAILETLKTMGIELAIDDFGTGYSSLSYLKRFPIGTLKIDRSFVHDIDADGNSDDAAIANAVIGMGRSLKQRVIAEGVETPEQLAFLRDRHCDEAQGYLFSRPLPAQDFAHLLASAKH